MDQFYCASGSTEEQKHVGATFTFPTPLDTTKDRYEIALIYSSFVPTWDTLTDVWLSVYFTDFTTKKPAEEFVEFTDFAYLPSNYVLPVIQDALGKRFGFRMDTGTAIKLMDFIDTDGKKAWYLKLNKGVKLEMSYALATFLGQPMNLTNNSKAVEEYKVTPMQIVRPLHEMYFLSCDQIATNYIMPWGGVGRILDFVHIPVGWQNRLLEHSPLQLSYHPVADDILLSKVDILLINNNGSPVSAINSEFFVLIHVRKLPKHGTNSEGQLA
jgi:hypothetical protein